MVNPASWAGVSVQEPFPLSVPAESVAPAGTPEMVTDRLSEPSLSTLSILMDSGMGVSSCPAAPATEGVATITGASATAARLTVKSAVASAVGTDTCEPVAASVETTRNVAFMSPA